MHVTTPFFFFFFFFFGGGGGWARGSSAVYRVYRPASLGHTEVSRDSENGALKYTQNIHKVDISLHIFIKIFGNIFLCIFLCKLITNDLSKICKVCCSSLETAESLITVIIAGILLSKSFSCSLLLKEHIPATCLKSSSV